MTAPFASPVLLQGHGLRLEPLGLQHETGLRAAAADGELWNLRVTSVPRPEDTAAYITLALDMQARGERLPWAVLDANTGRVIGCTSYHDIVAAVRRVEIGWTWYARSVQRSHVNTAAKLLLMTHAFETLNCTVVGWRTDILNHTSQRAIERLGAQRDGVLRSHALRRDGSIRDTVMYSLLASEWPDVRARLSTRLQAPSAPLPAGD
ncbi:GNAT family protein [Acidovorax sp. CCYZU-2555]|uniref:GNAT family N-acetyltransferase n=1 Tax=Acidovorax sp. CCYZU-2555 TaxID=2835042 RepID=UPI001BCF9FD5|nr:GNAT family protein [Acidovorax sp. CCYZU-2555]MBS7779085.1 GNAT family N-acetyltransferase [Acidovorax sp. CCYZU-2555]